MVVHGHSRVFSVGNLRAGPAKERTGPGWSDELIILQCLELVEFMMRLQL